MDDELLEATVDDLEAPGAHVVVTIPVVENQIAGVKSVTMKRMPLTVLREWLKGEAA